MLFKVYSLDAKGNVDRALFVNGTHDIKKAYREMRRDSGMQMKGGPQDERFKHLEELKNTSQLTLNNKAYKVLCFNDDGTPGKIVSECEVCEKTVDEGFRHDELGLIHHECKERIDNAVEAKELRISEEKGERYIRRRKDEMKLMLDLSYEHAKAQTMFGFFTKFVASEDGMETCMICNKGVDPNKSHGLHMGHKDGKIGYAHHRCLKNEVSKDPSGELLIKYEEFGMKLREEEIEELVQLWMTCKAIAEKQALDNRIITKVPEVVPNLKVKHQSQLRNDACIIVPKPDEKMDVDCEYSLAAHEGREGELKRITEENTDIILDALGTDDVKERVSSVRAGAGLPQPAAFKFNPETQEMEPVEAKPLNKPQEIVETVAVGKLEMSSISDDDDEEITFN